MMRSIVSAFCGVLIFAVSTANAAVPPPFPGVQSDWNGFNRFDFEVDGRPVLVVAPKSPAPGRPWVWHGEFFGHRPEPDIALLKRGCHVVYMKVPDMLGSPTAVQHWNAFYDELTQKYGFSRKVALVGLSRGGLYCYNWAAKNPEKVACIYGDAPVCDFKSWPGGKGHGKGSPRDWKLVLECYGFPDEAAAMAYDKNPVDNLAPLAKARVPLLHVYGEADDVVPWEENTGLLAQRYRELGGDITLIPKPGIGHHPHGLTDPTPIISFLAQHLALSDEAAVPEYAPVSAELVRPRGGLGNVLEKLKQGKPVKIAYLGGSITAASGWRIKSREWFSQEYPHAQVEEIHAAIGGTGSDLGVFRVQHDALQFKPDLMFVEFAVNDGGASPERIWKGMEGIVRQAWKADPHMDLCFVYTFAVGQEKDLEAGNCPRAASAMEMLADHYQIPSVNFAKKIVALQQAGKLIYKSDMPAPEGVIRFSQDGVHPLDDGHQIYTDVLADAIRQIAKSSRPIDHTGQLARPFIQGNWEQAKMVPVDSSMLTGDWKQLPSDASLQKSFGNRMGPLWEAARPGSKLSFKFRGSVAKLYDLLGPDGGQVVVTVDGKPGPKPIPRFDSYCTYHRIATLPIAEGLDPNVVHNVTIEIHPDQPDRTSIAFRLKNPAKELKEPKYQGTMLRCSQILVLGDVIPE
jgi:pimeloyl-ACP methyl ester carboxylesterase